MAAAELLLPTLPSPRPSAAAGTIKRLRLKHRRVLALHLQGCSNEEIASTLSISTSYIRSIINSDPGKAYLEAAFADFDKELRALVPRAIAAMRDTVESNDEKVRLHSAELILKANRKFDAPPGSGDSAEAVIERILERVGLDGTRVRIAERRIPIAALKEGSNAS